MIIINNKFEKDLQKLLKNTIFTEYDESKTQDTIANDCKNAVLNFLCKQDPDQESIKFSYRTNKKKEELAYKNIQKILENKS